MFDDTKKPKTDDRKDVHAEDETPKTAPRATSEPTFRFDDWAAI